MRSCIPFQSFQGTIRTAISILNFSFSHLLNYLATADHFHRVFRNIWTLITKALWDPWTLLHFVVLSRGVSDATLRRNPNACWCEDSGLEIRITKASLCLGRIATTSLRLKAFDRSCQTLFSQAGKWRKFLRVKQDQPGGLKVNTQWVQRERAEPPSPNKGPMKGWFPLNTN